MRRVRRPPRLILAIGVAVAMLLAAAAAAFGDGAKRSIDGSREGQLVNPLGVAVDARKHTVYVADSGHDRIVRYMADGEFVRAWGHRGGNTGEFRSPEGIAIDARGDVYVADTGNDRIQKFDEDGRFLGAWRTHDSPEDQGPAGIAVDPHGHVYVADTGNDRIQEFTAGLHPIRTFGGHGSAHGKLNSPHAVMVHGDRVYVADTGNERVQEFNAHGEFVREFRAGYRLTHETFRPRGLGVDGHGHVY